MGAILKGTLRKATRNVSECRNAGGYKILSYGFYIMLNRDCRDRCPHLSAGDS